MFVRFFFCHWKRAERSLVVTGTREVIVIGVLFPVTTVDLSSSFAVVTMVIGSKKMNLCKKKETESNKKLAGFLTPCSLGCRWNSFFITENTRHFRSETPGQVGPQHKLCCNPREINYWYMFQFYSFLLEELVYKKKFMQVKRFYPKTQIQTLEWFGRLPTPYN